MKTPARFVCAALLALAAGRAASAQQKLLTIDDLYDPQSKADFGGRPPSAVLWTSDTHFVYAKPEPDTRAADWLRVDSSTGRAEPLFDAAKLDAALARLPGVAPAEARRLSRLPRYAWNETRTAVVLEIAGDLYHYDLGAGKAARLTWSPGREEDPAVSPDGTQVAFTRGHDLYVVDVAGARERRLTADGSDEVLNGKLDWVYQEEVYGRGSFRAFWWSPDSRSLAFLRLDEKEVPKYTLVDDIPYRPVVESWHYPKAGDPNPGVKLGVVGASGGAPRFLDLAKYAQVQPLVVEVGFTPDSKEVVFQVQDREQRFLDLNLGSLASGETRTLFRETTPAWVDNPGPPRFLADGSFLWLSERSGFKHLYHYRRDGTLLRQITDGKWEVRALHGVDERKGYAYFSGTERSHIGGDVFRAKLDGGERLRLSQAAGTHGATFNPSFTLFADSWSDARTPPQLRVHRADGSELRLVEDNAEVAQRIAGYALVKPEFLEIRARDGFVMEAMLLKPPGFDPARSYPVFQHTYGGPHAPRVQDRWGGTGAMFHQLLAQRGIVVFVCDNRSASGKGAESAWAAYKRLGETELQDIEDGVDWLRQQPWVDAARIGIEGWSYGGFLTSYALTHSKSFAMGIAGGTVSDWRSYDSIYTERVMQLPQNNPDGYRKSSPRFAAKDLNGNLLLIHGAIDDNVHPQNTQQLAYELQQAGKPFRMMLYPKSRHGVTEPALVKHLRQTMLDFIEENLLGRTAGNDRQVGGR